MDESQSQNHNLSSVKEEGKAEKHRSHILTWNQNQKLRGLNMLEPGDELQLNTNVCIRMCFIGFHRLVQEIITLLM